MLMFAWDRVKGTFKNGIACVTDEVIKNFAKYTFVIAMVYQDSFFFYIYILFFTFFEKVVYQDSKSTKNCSLNKFFLTCIYAKSVLNYVLSHVC